MEELNFYDLLKYEVNEFYKQINEKAKIYDDMRLIQDIYQMLKSDNYVEINNMFLAFEEIFKEMLSLNTNGANNYLKQINDDIYTLMYYTESPERYEEKYIQQVKNRFEKFRNLIKKVCSDRQAEYIAKTPSTPKYVIKQYQQIMKNVRLGVPIEPSQYHLLEELFDKKGLSTKETILLFEQVRYHNNSIYLKEKGKFTDYNKKYKIKNILSFGYEKIDKIYYAGTRKNELDNLIKSFTQIGNSLNNDSFIEFLPKYNSNLKFDTNLDLIEFEYIINELLLHYQNQMFEDYNELNNIDNYKNKETRNLLANDYYDLLRVYKSLREFEYEQLEKYNSDLSEQKNNVEVNHLEYFCTSPTSERSYFESDLKSIPKDLYLLVNDLIIKFRNGQPLDTKFLTDHKSLIEIRNDQIRIVLKVEGNNNYGVIGVYQKKDTNDRMLVESVDNRNKVDKIDSPDYEKKLEEILTTNFHQGGRKNT